MKTFLLFSFLALSCLPCVALDEPQPITGANAHEAANEEFKTVVVGINDILLARDFSKLYDVVCPRVRAAITLDELRDAFPSDWQPAKVSVLKRTIYLAEGDSFGIVIARITFADEREEHVFILFKKYGKKWLCENLDLGRTTLPPRLKYPPAFFNTCSQPNK